MTTARSLTYFLSDIHLGLDYEGESSSERETILVDWLISIEDSAARVYFVGDIFDYWFEYGEGRQPNYPLFFGQLKAMVSLGIEIHFFAGNHDLWMHGYFPDKYGFKVYHKPQVLTLSKQVFLLAHGDGLGKGDDLYKLLKKLMTHSVTQWLYSLFPAKLGLSIMRSVSQKSRLQHVQDSFQSFAQERLIQYCESHVDRKKINYFIFGHRHLPIRYRLQQSSAEYINLGDWIKYKSYAYFDGVSLHYSFLQSESEAELITNHIS